MKKRIIGLVLGTLALSLGVFLGVGSFNKEAKVAKAYYSPSTHYEVSDTASELASYYSSISDSDSGTSLLSKLQTLNSSKRKKTMGYGTIGTDTSGAVIYTDYDLNSTAKDSNGQTYGTKVASFYTKTAATGWNREHMWPNSHGGNNVEADILHTRPTISSENSSRGNSFYVEGKNSSSAGWDPYTAGYDAEVRGECARVILYCVVAYPSFTLSDADLHSTSNNNKDNMMGNMNTLIKWHFDYAPNVYEINRNNGAEYLQGNRNPFVDHPEYVAKIWSNFNSTVSNLCSTNSSKYSSWTPGNYCNYGENTPVNNDGVTISKSSDSLNVGSTTTLSATASNSGTISWTTSNSSVASISSSSSASGANITVTGVSAGTATITAKATISGTQYSSTCTITVTKVVSSLSKGSTSPTKTTYTAGESFDPTGLTITATYSDSTSSVVTSSVVWSPDPLTAGTTSVTGTFGGKTITISGLTVEAATEPEIIDSNSDLSVGDYVVLRTAAGVGVTGWNNNKDATVSETESEWKKYYVASASSSGFTLKDESANNFIASPGSSNQFIYGSAATCSTDSDGHLICNSRYLCKNGTNYRFYTSVGSYLPFFIYKVPGSSSTKTLSSISVSTAPTKTSYTAGEYFDPTGLVITRTYSDSTSDTYTYIGHTSEFTFSPSISTALTTSNTSVTITYGGKSCSQAITVNAAKTLSSISVSTAPTKTTYTAGETFDPTGLTIRRNYSDSTYDTYTYSGHTSEFTFSPSTSTALTTSNVSVTITYGGKSTTQAITVNASSKTLSSISVSGGKTSFAIDEDFSFGGTVTANFSDSTSSDVTASATFSGYNMSVAGNYTVTVSYTYGGTTKTATYNITVAASGGGGGESGSFSGTYNYGNQGTGSGKTWSLTDCTDQSSYWLCPASGTESVANIPDIFENKTITSNVVITINSGTYGSGSNPSSSTFTVYTSSACTSQVTATQTGTLPTSKTYTDAIYTVSLANASSFSNDLAIKITKPGKQIRLVSITVEFDYTTSGSSTPTLSSISVATEPTKTTYTVGEYFSPTGLVINRNFSDSTSDTYTYVGHTSEFTFSPSTSTALTTDDVSVTITYGGKSCSQTISVTATPATSITATCNKTFYVGETITKSDITVTTNTSENVTSSVTFADYQFTYADASSGGALTDKQFQITYNDLNTTLTVQVQRKAYGTPTGTEPYSITYTDLPTSYQTSTSEREAASGVKFIAYNLANYSSKMQFKASGGYFQTTQAMTLKSLTINNRESNELTVYGSTNGSSFSSAISGTNDVYDLTGYSYVKVMKNGSGAAYCSSLTIEVASLETAENVANDIMYEDTVNQCVEKLDAVLLELNNLSESELNTFATSSDYVISTARERLEAWARNQGKSIDYSSAGAVALKSINNKLFTSINESIGNTLIIIICSISVTSLFALYAIIKKKKGDR